MRVCDPVCVVVIIVVRRRLELSIRSSRGHLLSEIARELEEREVVQRGGQSLNGGECVEVTEEKKKTKTHLLGRRTQISILPRTRRSEPKPIRQRSQPRRPIHPTSSSLIVLLLVLVAIAVRRVLSRSMLVSHRHRRVPRLSSSHDGVVSLLSGLVGSRDEGVPLGLVEGRTDDGEEVGRTSSEELDGVFSDEDEVTHEAETEPERRGGRQVNGGSREEGIEEGETSTYFIESFNRCPWRIFSTR